ncbi:MAG: hypothetical protein H6742_05275 [Alphaproteobacteria bacterium]|nr:hypothetical protein [Alphaproteobacteria bacterium]
MPLLSSLILLPVLWGCGYSYDKFSTEGPDAICAKYEECGLLDFWGGTVESCMNYQEAALGGVEADGSECPNYDKDAAQECVEDWELLTCEQLNDGQTPTSCEKVCSAGSGTAE